MSVQPNTDSEINFTDSSATTPLNVGQIIKYILAGIFFGTILVKSEVVSWFRIQEMFRFQAFHMYGIIGSAVITAALSVWLIKMFKVRSAEGEQISVQPKKFHKGLIPGGLLFGTGWALTGACPGPIFALIGSGQWAFVVVLLSAIAGTYVYGLLYKKLPH